MAAVNGVPEGADKGGPPPPSPLTGCYLLIVVGEPHSKEHRDIILQRVAKGLLSWDVNDCLVDLEKELAIITEQAPEGEEARYGERLIQFASENLVTEVLIHPVVSTLAQCVRNLLSSFTRHRHIIHAGYTFAANGSWILQDGTFSLADFSEAFQEIEVQRVIRAYENGISMDIHCSPEGDWNGLPKEPFARYCKVRINPNDVLTSGSPSISSFIDYLSPFLIPAEIETLLESSDVVGNIRFSHPTLYVFPGGQGDAALFGINGFNMLLDGGFSRKSCFWDFVRHLDRLDAVLLTRLNNSNVNGISAVLRRKRQNAVYPQIGHFFCNIPERKAVLSPDGDKDKDPLLINILEEGHEIISDLQYLNLAPQACYRDSEPINLYHKVGHGTLDMYVLSPARDSKEVREFIQKWNNNDQKLFSCPKNNKDFVFPVQNLVSICALLVWQPANPDDNITRILYPGSTPQHKIFEGLEKIKHLGFVKHPVCSENSLTPSVSAIALKAKPIIDRIVPEPKTTRKILENKQKEKLAKDADVKKTENKVIENGEAGDIIEKQIKKSESIEGDKIAPKVQKPKKLETEKEATEKTEDKKAKPKEEPKPKVEAKPKPRSESQQRKPKPAEKKASPTTPKKTIDTKVNGEAPKAKPVGKASPQSTPAKSAKEASNRKVVESKYKQTARPPPKPPAEKKEAKQERKPVTRKAKEAPAARAPGSPLKKVNGVAKTEVAVRKARLDKEGTTDSSTVSTPSADQDSILKKDISKMTPDEIEKLKAQELADLKEEQEVVKEIEAVFRKGEVRDEKFSDMRKIKDISVEDKEKEEYLVIEKEEIVQVITEVKEDEKITRDSEESEKQKVSPEKTKTDAEQTEEQKPSEATKVTDVLLETKEKIASKEESVASPEDKVDTSSERKTIDRDVEGKEIPESQPDEKVSGNVESGATTTAPTLPEDERIPLDEIKEDNGDQAIEEKHVKEETKEKEVPVIQLPPKPLETVAKLPPVVGIRLDKHTNIRDLVKTPDEVADLPVHEEADIHHYEEYQRKEEESKAGDQKLEVDLKEPEVKDEKLKEKDEASKKEKTTEKLIEKASPKDEEHKLVKVAKEDEKLDKEISDAGTKKEEELEKKSEEKVSKEKEKVEIKIVDQEIPTPKETKEHVELHQEVTGVEEKKADTEPKVDEKPPVEAKKEEAENEQKKFDTEHKVETPTAEADVEVKLKDHKEEKLPVEEKKEEIKKEEEKIGTDIKLAADVTKPEVKADIHKSLGEELAAVTKEDDIKKEEDKIDVHGKPDITTTEIAAEVKKELQETDKKIAALQKGEEKLSAQAKEEDKKEEEKTDIIQQIDTQIAIVAEKVEKEDDKEDKKVAEQEVLPKEVPSELHEGKIKEAAEEAAKKLVADIVDEKEKQKTAEQKLQEELQGEIKEKETKISEEPIKVEEKPETKSPELGLETKKEAEEKEEVASVDKKDDKLPPETKEDKVVDEKADVDSKKDAKMEEVTTEVKKDERDKVKEVVVEHKQDVVTSEEKEEVRSGSPKVEEKKERDELKEDKMDEKLPMQVKDEEMEERHEDEEDKTLDLKPCELLSEDKTKDVEVKKKIDVGKESPLQEDVKQDVEKVDIDRSPEIKSVEAISKERKDTDDKTAREKLPTVIAKDEISTKRIDVAEDQAAKEKADAKVEREKPTDSVKVTEESVTAIEKEQEESKEFPKVTSEVKETEKEETPKAADAVEEKADAEIKQDKPTDIKKVAEESVSEIKKEQEESKVTTEKDETQKAADAVEIQFTKEAKEDQKTDEAAAKDTKLGGKQEKEEGVSKPDIMKHEEKIDEKVIDTTEIGLKLQESEKKEGVKEVSSKEDATPLDTKLSVKPSAPVDLEKPTEEQPSDATKVAQKEPTKIAVTTDTEMQETKEKETGTIDEKEESSVEGAKTDSKVETKKEDEETEVTKQSITETIKIVGEEAIAKTVEPEIKDKGKEAAERIAEPQPFDEKVDETKSEKEVDKKVVDIKPESLQEELQKVVERDAKVTQEEQQKILKAKEPLIDTKEDEVSKIEAKPEKLVGEETLSQELEMAEKQLETDAAKEETKTEETKVKLTEPEETKLLAEATDKSASEKEDVKLASPLSERETEEKEKDSKSQEEPKEKEEVKETTKEASVDTPVSKKEEEVKSPPLKVEVKLEDGKVSPEITEAKTELADESDKKVAKDEVEVPKKLPGESKEEELKEEFGEEKNEVEKKPETKTEPVEKTAKDEVDVQKEEPLDVKRKPTDTSEATAIKGTTVEKSEGTVTAKEIDSKAEQKHVESDITKVPVLLEEKQILDQKHSEEERTDTIKTEKEEPSKDQITEKKTKEHESMAVDEKDIDETQPEGKDGPVAREEISGIKSEPADRDLTKEQAVDSDVSKLDVSETSTKAISKTEDVAAAGDSEAKSESTAEMIDADAKEEGKDLSEKISTGKESPQLVSEVQGKPEPSSDEEPKYNGEALPEEVSKAEDKPKGSELPTSKPLPDILKKEDEKMIVMSVLQDAQQVAKVDKKLQELKSKVTDIPETVVSEPKAVLERRDSPAKAFIDKSELGSKSPKEREEDVVKIVATVAEVLKSDAPLEELEGKVYIPGISSFGSYTTQLRETHITTVDSPTSDVAKKFDDTLEMEPVLTKPEVTAVSLEQERKTEYPTTESRISHLVQDSKDLMQETSKIIADIKSGKPSKSEEKETDEAAEEQSGGTVHRMLVTASSEDGGEETVICPTGSITFSRSSESSGRSSPDIQSESLSTTKSVIDLKSSDTKKVEVVQDTKELPEEKSKEFEDANKVIPSEIDLKTEKDEDTKKEKGDKTQDEGTKKEIVLLDGLKPDSDAKQEQKEDEIIKDAGTESKPREKQMEDVVEAVEVDKKEDTVKPGDETIIKEDLKPEEKREPIPKGEIKETGTTKEQKDMEERKESSPAVEIGEDKDKEKKEETDIGEKEKVAEKASGSKDLKVTDEKSEEKDGKIIESEIEEKKISDTTPEDLKKEIIAAPEEQKDKTTPAQKPKEILEKEQGKVEIKVTSEKDQEKAEIRLKESEKIKPEEQSAVILKDQEPVIEDQSLKSTEKESVREEEIKEIKMETTTEQKQPQKEETEAAEEKTGLKAEVKPIKEEKPSIKSDISTTSTEKPVIVEKSETDTSKIQLEKGDKDETEKFLLMEKTECESDFVKSVVEVDSKKTDTVIKVTDASTKPPEGKETTPVDSAKPSDDKEKEDHPVLSEQQSEVSEVKEIKEEKIEASKQQPGETKIKEAQKTPEKLEPEAVTEKEEPLPEQDKDKIKDTETHPEKHTGDKIIESTSPIQTKEEPTDVTKEEKITDSPVKPVESKDARKTTGSTVKDETTTLSPQQETPASDAAKTPEKVEPAVIKEKEEISQQKVTDKAKSVESHREKEDEKITESETKEEPSAATREGSIDSGEKPVEDKETVKTEESIDKKETTKLPPQQEMTEKAPEKAEPEVAKVKEGTSQEQATEKAKAVESHQEKAVEEKIPESETTVLPASPIQTKEAVKEAITEHDITSTVKPIESKEAVKTEEATSTAETTKLSPQQETLVPDARKTEKTELGVVKGKEETSQDQATEKTKDMESHQEKVVEEKISESEKTASPVSPVQTKEDLKEGTAEHGIASTVKPVESKETEEATGKAETAKLSPQQETLVADAGKTEKVELEVIKGKEEISEDQAIEKAKGVETHPEKGVEEKISESSKIILPTSPVQTKEDLKEAISKDDVVPTLKPAESKIVKTEEASSKAEATKPPVQQETPVSVAGEISEKAATEVIKAEGEIIQEQTTGKTIYVESLPEKSTEEQLEKTSPVQTKDSTREDSTDSTVKPVESKELEKTEEPTVKKDTTKLPLQRETPVAEAEKAEPEALKEKQELSQEQATDKAKAVESHQEKSSDQKIAESEKSVSAASTVPTKEKPSDETREDSIDSKVKPVESKDAVKTEGPTSKEGKSPEEAEPEVIKGKEDKVKVVDSHQEKITTEQTAQHEKASPVQTREERKDTTEKDSTDSKVKPVECEEVVKDAATSKEETLVSVKVELDSTPPKDQKKEDRPEDLSESAGPSKRKDSTSSRLSPSAEDANLSGKSTPDIADVERLKEMQEILKHEKHIPGSSTPPTVPVSPVVRDEVEYQSSMSESAKAEVKKSADTSPLSSIKDTEIRSITPASDDFERSDISSGQMSRAPPETERRDNEEEDVPGSPNSVTSQVAHSEFDDDSVKIQEKVDQMSVSFYGSLPDDPKLLDEADLDFEKALEEHRQTRGEDLAGREATSTFLYEVTTAKYGATGGLVVKEETASSSLMTASFIGELPEEQEREDPLKKWGKPLGLPSPAPPNDNKGTPKKERKLPPNVTAKNKINDDRKRADSPSKYDRKKKTNAVYVDLTYVPHHGNSNYSYVDFFKRVRARYYVFSGIEPSKEVYNALLEAKQTWEDKELEVTIIPTYDTDILGYWVAENEDLLAKYKIDLSPSASRCTINLQDHETSCSAYRLEF